MTLMKLIIVIGLMCLNICEIFGHGFMIDPPSRSSAWRKKFKTPVNWDDNGLYCGGLTVSCNKKLLIIYLHDLALFQKQYNNLNNITFLMNNNDNDIFYRHNFH